MAKPEIHLIRRTLGEALRQEDPEGLTLSRDAQGLLLKGLSPPARSYKKLGALADLLRHGAEEGFWPRWLIPALLLAGLLLGLGSNLLGPSRRIDILSPALLALLAWNATIYLAAGVWWWKGRKATTRHPRHPAADWLLRPLRLRGHTGRQTTGAAPGEKIVQGAVEQLIQSLKPLYSLRLQGAFQAAAWCLGLGLIAGMYARGLLLEYRAGWASTFLEAEGFRSLLVLILGPASWLTGIAIPPAEGLESLRWSAETNGEIAARWIHLQAATTALFVLLPRGLWWARTQWRLRHWPVGAAATPDAKSEDPASPTGSRGAPACVLPYCVELTPECRQRTRLALDRLKAGGAEARFLEPLPFGEEEEAARHLPSSLPEARVWVLFGFGATPEAEQHGLVLDALAVTPDKQGPARPTPAVLLEDSGFRARMGEDETGRRRWQERRAAWERFLDTRQLTAHIVSRVLDGHPEKPRT